MSWCKAIKQNFSDICYVVAVGVFQKNDLCLRSDNQPFAKWHQTVCERQLVSEDVSLVDLAIAVRVFQVDDSG